MPKMKGNKTIYSSQEATQLIFMNSDSEGENVELGEDFGEDSEKDSDWEPEEEDIDYQTAEEEEDICNGCGLSALARGLRDSGELRLPPKGAVLSLALLLVRCLQ